MPFRTVLKRASSPPKRASSPKRASPPKKESPKRASPPKKESPKKDPSEQEIERYITHKIRNAKKDKHAIIMVGGPGSGKTSGANIVLNMVKKEYSDYVLINPDDALEVFFNSDRRFYSGANPINDLLYERALNTNCNVIIDRTGTNFEVYNSTVISKIKNKGYKVVLCIVYNNYASASIRIKKREAETGRAVNEAYARGSYRDLTFNIPKYIALHCQDVDDIFCFDNTSSSIELLYRSTCKNGRKVVTINNLF
jgi:predicted ABC-type ATPase